MSEPTIEQLINKLTNFSSKMASGGFTAREYVEFAVAYRDARAALLTRAKRAESSLAKWREIAGKLADHYADIAENLEYFCTRCGHTWETGHEQHAPDCPITAYRALLNEESGE